MAEEAMQVDQLPSQDDSSDLADASMTNIDANVQTPEGRRFTKEERKSFEPPKDQNGQFYCDFPHPQSEECATLRFKRKCEYHKHMDKHLRPHVCQVEGCNQPGFTYPGGLRRHEAEVHGMHGGPKERLFCPYPYCKRNSGEPFTRRENMQEHISRLHTKGKENNGEGAKGATDGEADNDDENAETSGEGDMVDTTDAAATATAVAAAAAEEDTSETAAPVPSAEELEAAANATSLNPNIDPAFTQQVIPVTPPAIAPAAVAPASTPTEPARKKRKAAQATFKASEYTPAAATSALEQSTIRQLREKLTALEEQNHALRVNNAELIETNIYLRQRDDQLTAELSNLRGALTGVESAVEAAS